MNMADYIIQLLGGVDKFLSALIVFLVINYIAEMLLVIVGGGEAFQCVFAKEYV